MHIPSPTATAHTTIPMRIIRLPSNYPTSSMPYHPQHEQPPTRKSRRHLAPLIPAGHGLAAVVTFVLAVLSAINSR